MAHALSLDVAATQKTEAQPEQRPPAQPEAEELSEAQLQAVVGGNQPQPIQPCI